MKERSRCFEQREKLATIRQSIPFLNQIPDAIYYALDPSEFYIPRGRVADVKLDLEQELQQHVMTYKRDVFKLDIPVQRHLCANIKGAELSLEQLQLLQAEERRLRTDNVSFVAYQNPLELIDPRKSDLNTYYRMRGLR